MTVAELKAELAKHPDDMEVVFDKYEDEMGCYNFIQASYVGKDNQLHLYEF